MPTDTLPQLDREALKEAIRQKVEELPDAVADAVDAAAPGRVIRDSEEPVRDAAAQFRQQLYQCAVQLNSNTKAIWPPGNA
jgi:hypothetical protein